MQEGAPIIIKKKKAHGHGHHGGAWKVAYADFVTAMMAFFMVMWILGMSDEQKDAIAAYFNDPTGFSKKIPKYDPSLGITDRNPKGPNGAGEAAVLEKENQELDEIKQEIQQGVEADPELQKLAEKGDVQLQSTVDGLLIELIENETTGEVFFELGSAAVRPEAEKMFSMIGGVLAKAKRPIEIEGHTDALPYPGAGYDNFDLSGDRAQSVRRILQRGGVRNSQIVSIDAKGDTEPRLPENPRHFSNRRVTILLPYNLVKGPGVKLPLDVTDHSVEGMASLPKNIRPDRVDLKSKGTPDNHQPEETSGTSHDTGH